ncbi:MAG: lantibiotic dehydratase family protein, partial [Sporichthyaceae bacterium]|nr:lantibiotic dehydratase family protein [Sporichthyaceae bacterium]
MAEHGPGGRCRDIGEFFEQVGELWLGLSDGDAEDATAGGAARLDQPRIAELMRLRQQVTDAVADPARREGAGQVAVPLPIADDIAAALPVWIRRRPASYSFFVQPTDGDGTLCLTQVYGGWGRFTSRFLDLFEGPGARRAVGDQVRRHLGARRVVQFRPLHGFNANRHPLVVPEEISDDPRQATLLTSQVELVHDLDSDQVRVRAVATGELLDVLYLGFLAPVALPVRVGALLGDLGSAGVGLARMAPTTTVEGRSGTVVRQPRLRYGRVVLSRRSWLFDPAAATALRDAWAPDDAVARLLAVATERATWDLPDQVFLAPAAGRPVRDVAEFRRLLAGPKPQFADLANPLHQRC